MQVNSFARQVRGHIRITGSPTLGVILVLLTLWVCFSGRNLESLVDFDIETRSTRIDYGAAIRVALLQGATLVGIAVAALTASNAVQGLSRREDVSQASLLEPSALKRFVLDVLNVLAIVGVWMLSTSVAIFLTAWIQAERLGGETSLDFNTWGQIRQLVPYVALVVSIIATTAVGVAVALRATPLIAAATLTGGAFSLLLLQHLLGTFGDRFVPTAWIAASLQLPGSEFGESFIWTSGAGHPRSALLLVLLGLITFALAYVLIRRSEQI